MTASAPFDPTTVERFTYVGHDWDPAGARLTCRYALDDRPFEETVEFELPGGRPAPGAVDQESLAAVARLVFLLAGVSYYKAAAPPRIEIPDGLRPTERELLRGVYLHGLGEYAYRNDLDLSAVEIVAPHLADVEPRRPPDPGRVLVPFGGGIDSIVTVEGLRDLGADLALFVMSRPGDRFDAIEAGAAVTGLPIVRAERRIDDQVLRSAELGFRNGHVPITGILTAIATMAALLDGRGAVAMSNEWSASAGNLVWNGAPINHQWSKSLAFEDLFRATLDAAVPAPPDVFSWLRPRSELWVAERFAALTRYHRAFRSCNRSFHLDRARRLDRWCGTCDKCCFIDLILAPFVPAADLAAVFDGLEPLDRADLVGTFRNLLALSDGDVKPFECVGDVDECRVALLLARRRDDRRDSPVLAALADPVADLVGDADHHASHLLRPLGPHRIPTRHAPPDLLG